MPVFILLLLIKDAKTSMSKDDYKEKTEEEKDGTEQNG